MYRTSQTSKYVLGRFWFGRFGCFGTFLVPCLGRFGTPDHPHALFCRAGGAANFDGIGSFRLVLHYSWAFCCSSEPAVARRDVHQYVVPGGDARVERTAMRRVAPRRKFQPFCFAGRLETPAETFWDARSPLGKRFRTFVSP